MKTFLGRMASLVSGLASGFWAEIMPPAPAPLADPALVSPPETSIDEDQARIRAQRAGALLQDPLISEAFATLERAYIAAWRATRSDQHAERERLWDALAVLESVRAQLRGVANGAVLLDQSVRALTRRSTTSLREDRTSS